MAVDVSKQVEAARVKRMKKAHALFAPILALWDAVDSRSRSSGGRGTKWWLKRKARMKMVRESRRRNR